MNMNGKTVVITGGAQGLGLAIATAVVNAGGLVALLDIDGNALAKAKADLGDTDCTTINCDVRNLASVNAAVEKIAQWRPCIDVVINNAGAFTNNEIEITDPARRQVAFDTNALGPIHLTNAMLPILRKQDSAHILNVISAAGDALSLAGDNRAWLTYGATKWAMTGFTKTLRESLADTNIKVSGFFPAGMDTNFYENAGFSPDHAHGQEWMMSATDAAEVILFMLTRPSSVLIESMTVTKFTQSPA